MANPAAGTGKCGGTAAPVGGRREAERVTLLVAGGLVLLGALLRAWSTQGDLWLDEIWTIELVQPLAGWWQVFTEIPHDNNHWLNSAWVMLAGPDAPGPVLRAASVLFGTAAIVAAGLAVRSGPARLAAMALVAVSPALVNYGSEARGYAGLILATLLAVAIARRDMEHRTRAGPLLLGLAAALGLFSHAFMVEALAVLAAWSIGLQWSRGGPAAALAGTARLFWPAVLAGAAWGACLAWAISRHGYAFGGMFVATPVAFVSGWAESLRMVFGAPDSWPPWACLVAGGGLLAVVLANWQRDPFVLLCAIGVVAIPVALYLLSIPNTVFGRYFLIPALFLLLAMAEVFGRAVEEGGIRQGIAGAALAAVLGMQVAGVVDFLVQGRGSYGEAVSRMAGEDGEPTYGSDRAARAQRIVSFYAARQQVAARLVPEEQWCADPPRWMIRDARDAPDRLSVCAQAPRAYRLVARWPSWRYSGAPWSLFRRVDPVGGGRVAPLIDLAPAPSDLGLRPGQ